ncbi:MAG: TetR/AcrR family transcriptional regulator, partial [Ignavibacteria bacterium]|nr:TetR/AcrR family transcriptional regulator [Ignavibacteria bacterium]
QIIKTAVKRFARHGLNKTTLTEIARDLRIGKATIYHYFNSKEELFYQTMEYDASLVVEDIKQIFNNEQLSTKERFLEYFNYKQEIYNKYKLLYDVMIRVLKEEGPEKEHEILKKLLQNEEEVLKLVLSSLYNSKIESMNPELPKFFAMQSWGILFGKKLNDIRSDGTIQSSKDLLLESLDNFIS